MIIIKKLRISSVVLIRYLVILKKLNCVSNKFSRNEAIYNMDAKEDSRII